MYVFDFMSRTCQTMTVLVTRIGVITDGHFNLASSEQGFLDSGSHRLRYSLFSHATPGCCVSLSAKKKPK